MAPSMSAPNVMVFGIGAGLFSVGAECHGVFSVSGQCHGVCSIGGKCHSAFSIGAECECYMLIAAFADAGGMTQAMEIPMTYASALMLRHHHAGSNNSRHAQGPVTHLSGSLTCSGPVLNLGVTKAAIVSLKSIVEGPTAIC